MELAFLPFKEQHPRNHGGCRVFSHHMFGTIEWGMGSIARSKSLEMAPSYTLQQDPCLFVWACLRKTGTPLIPFQ